MFISKIQLLKLEGSLSVAHLDAAALTSRVLDLEVELGRWKSLTFELERQTGESKKLGADQEKRLQRVEAIMRLFLDCMGYEEVPPGDQWQIRKKEKQSHRK